MAACSAALSGKAYGGGACGGRGGADGGIGQTLTMSPSGTAGRLSNCAPSAEPVLWLASEPSCPEAPSPKQMSSPVSTTTQVCSWPAEMASALRRTPLPSLRSISGSAAISPAELPAISSPLPMVVGSKPSCPDAPAPQHLTPPVSSRAQVWHEAVLLPEEVMAMAGAPRLIVGRSAIGLELSPRPTSMMVPS